MLHVNRVRMHPVVGMERANKQSKQQENHQIPSNLHFGPTACLGVSLSSHRQELAEPGLGARKDGLGLIERIDFPIVCRLGDLKVLPDEVTARWSSAL